MTLRVRRDLCLGCGLCVRSCPRQAISITLTAAEIDQSKCNQCCLCTEVCPQGAIIKSTPVSEADLATAISSLKQKADDLLERIEKLRK
jgi:ferredoxin